MLIHNLRIVLPDYTLEQGWLHLEEGRIAVIGEGDAPPAGGGLRVDGSGLTALPGIIDIHGDMLEREIEPRPNVHLPTDMALFELDKRLAASGVTTAYAALSFYETDQEDSVRSRAVVREMIATINQLRAALLVDCYVHARFEVSTPSIAPFLVEMLTAEQVHMVSLMDHTPGQGQYRNIEHYITFIAKWRRVDRAHVQEEVMRRLAEAHDPQSNWELAREIVALAVDQGLPIASHDDDTLEKVDLVASLGATICEFPVTLEAAMEAQQRGMHVVMGAPNILRGGSHSGNLSAIEAVAAGVVDMLAADYYPAALLHSIFMLVDAGVLPLHVAARLVSQNPAAALGLHDRGSIAVGKSADLALVEAGGRPRVRATLRRGTPIYWDGVMAGRSRC